MSYIPHSACVMRRRVCEAEKTSSASGSAYEEAIANGMDPEDAIIATAGTLEQQMQPQLEQPATNPMDILNKM